VNVLLLLPDFRLCEFVRNGLRGEGMMVSCASSMADAASLLRACAFDLVILQDHSHGEPARELCATFRYASPATAILQIGDRTEHLAGELTAGRGPDKLMSRPFEFDDLLDTVRALAAKAHRQHEQQQNQYSSHHPLMLGDLLIDRDRYEVRRNGELINLTAKEYQVLCMLTAAPGKPFSRTRILQAVWGYHDDPLTNVVEVHIFNLRRKLSRDSSSHASSLIQTVRGVGYRLLAPTPAPAMKSE
jgi:DNA-binding response OmpR family regulator